MLNGANGRAEVSENVFAGIVGAILFALAGAVVWFLLWQIGYIAGLSGIVGVVCAIKGYSIFGKRESIKGVIISVIATLAVMVLAWYLCLSLDVFNAYKDWYAEGYVDFTITFGEAVRNAHVFLEDPEISREYISSLVTGLVFCVIGGIGYVVGSIRKVKGAKACSGQAVCEPEHTEYTNAVEPTADAFDNADYTYTRLNGEEQNLKGNE